MAGKIAVVGDRESVLGFRSVGFDVFAVTEPKQAADVIKKLAEEEYGIIFVTEHSLTGEEAVLERYKDSRIPAIIPIPGKDGSTGLGLANVRKSVERAVGADILFK